MLADTPRDATSICTTLAEAEAAFNNWPNRYRRMVHCRKGTYDRWCASLAQAEEFFKLVAGERIEPPHRE
jgi:hypothetical protein